MADHTPSVQSPHRKPSPFSLYIGEKSTTIKFSDIPINDEIDFNFIVSFARDYNNNDQPTDGLFEAYWDKSNLSKENIEDIRARHHRVKVLFSIGASDARFPFHPASKKTWAANALKSLKEIISNFRFDGIDIHYKSFTAKEDEFSERVGNLIKSLKQEYGNKNFIVSISPSPENKSYYQDLYDHHKSNIDFVNYQLYAESDPIKTREDYKSIYKSEMSYYGAKLLAGFSSDRDDFKILSDNIFFRAVTDLEESKELGGIFIWSADNSELDQNNFEYEEKAQKILESSE